MSKQVMVIGVLLFVSACSSAPPERHEYSLMLAELPRSDATVVPKTETLNIRRVDLPDFLQTRALVIQVSESEIVSARHHSWAGRLDVSIAKVLKLVLVEERPELSIGDATDVACQLDIEFDRFHAAAKGEVLASGRYLLDMGGAITSHNFDVSRGLPVGGHSNAVGELRRSLNDLGSEIIESIEAAGGCT